MQVYANCLKSPGAFSITNDFIKGPFNEDFFTEITKVAQEII